eukprot:5871626-Amphidinium_carterae.2
MEVLNKTPFESASLFGWKLTALVISTAKYGNQGRVIHLKVDAGVAALLRELPGFEDLTTPKKFSSYSRVKSAYGLVDAPKHWLESLALALKEANWNATLLDPANTVSGELDGVLSLHVDDIKLASDSEISKALIDTLTKRFGALKVQEREFEHCSLRHVQQEDGTAEIHQTTTWTQQ